MYKVILSVVSEKEENENESPTEVVHQVFSATPPVWFGRTGCQCTAALSVAMATSRQRGPKGPALSQASQTAVPLRIASIHMSTEAEHKWVSPHVEEKLKSRLTSLTLPGGGGVKTIHSRIDILRDHQHMWRSEVRLSRPRWSWRCLAVSTGKVNFMR